MLRCWNFFILGYSQALREGNPIITYQAKFEKGDKIRFKQFYNRSFQKGDEYKITECNKLWNKNHPIYVIRNKPFFAKDVDDYLELAKDQEEQETIPEGG